MGNQLIPAGTVVYVARDTAPEGWLVADGRDVSRTQYADLFAAIRVKFGMGDGIDTFNLPDLRGEFIRGLDGGKGLDSGRIFGSTQLDAFQGHWHQSYSANNGSGYGGLAGTTSSYVSMGVRAPVIREAITDGVHGIPRTASETRPHNIALLACIKY
jgi:microcystin-dependent protein